MRIGKRQAERLKWKADYVLSETLGGRHLWASLGSAGLTFMEDIAILKEYCKQTDHPLYAILDKDKEI